MNWGFTISGMMLRITVLVIFWVFSTTALFAQPSNDDCANAIELFSTDPCSPVVGTVDDATSSGTDDCVGTADDDVWYFFVANSASYDIEVDGYGNFINGIDVVIGVYSGNCSSLTNIDCEDGTLAGGTETLTVGGLTIGNTYYIQIYDYFTGEPGNPDFDICITENMPPPNDECIDAIDLTQNPNCSYTAGFTGGATDSGIDNCTGTENDDVWYCFTATGSSAAIDVDGASGFDAVIGVYSGTCGSLTLLDCEDGGGSGAVESTIIGGLTPGQKYFIQVYHWSSADPSNDNFDICVYDPPTGDCGQSNVQATVLSCNNCTINDGSAQGNQFGDPNLEVTADGCGPVTILVEYAFDWDQGSGANWIHGISYTAGPLWTGFEELPPTGWIFMPNGVTGDCSGISYGPGYYYDTNGDDGSSFCNGGDSPGDPSDNFGVNCDGSACPSFQFELTYCATNSTPSQFVESISFSVTEDGASGGWNIYGNCNLENFFNITINNSCGPEAAFLDPPIDFCTAPDFNLMNSTGGYDMGDEWTGSVVNGAGSPNATLSYCDNLDNTSISHTVGENGCEDGPFIEFYEVYKPAIQNVMVSATEGCGNTDVTLSADVDIDNMAGFQDWFTTVSEGGNMGGGTLVFEDQDGNIYSPGMNTLPAEACAEKVYTLTPKLQTGCDACDVEGPPVMVTVYPTFTLDLVPMAECGTAHAHVLGTDGTICDMVEVSCPNPGDIGSATYDFMEAVGTACELTANGMIECSCYVCNADAGTVDPIPTGCVGTPVNIDASNYYVDPDYQEYILVVDDSGVIIEFGPPPHSFTPTDCDDYFFFSYNYDINDPLVVIPVAGTTLISDIDCTVACCDLEGPESANFGEMGTVTINVPADMTFQCDMAPTEDGSGASVSGNTCPVNLVYDGETIVAGSCPNAYQATYQWTATDVCGNVFVEDYTITVEDTMAPTFDNPPSPVPDITCGGMVPPQETLTATDNCSTPTITESTQPFTPDDCAGYAITYVWDVEDDCMNTDQTTLTITILGDTDPPMLVIPMDATVSCEMIPSEDGSGATATDNCTADNDITLNYLGETDNSDMGCPYQIIRTWQAVDLCGNDTGPVSQTITVEDNIFPMIAAVPGDETLNCYTEFNPAIPDLTWSDNCTTGGTVVGTQNPTDASSMTCPGGSIVRTWTVMDDCGNVTTETQTITILPYPLVDWINPPADITLGCTDPIPSTDSMDHPLSYMSSGTACTESGMVTPIITGAITGCNTSMTLDWTYTDMLACNTITHTQTITLEDTEEPQLQNEPGDLTYNCAGEVPPIADLAWIDNCDGTGMVPGQESGSIDNCIGGSITRAWTYTDACGNTDTHIQIITVNPVPDLMWTTSLPPDITLSCTDPIPPVFDLDYSNNASSMSCLENGTVSPTESGTLNVCGDMITRLWEVPNPVCGPPLSFTQTLTLEDTELPELQNEPLDLTFDCASDLTPMGDLTWTDNCDGTGVVSGVEDGTIDNCTGGAITRTWTYTDMCGNTDTHVQNITVNPVPDIVWTSTLPPSNVILDCDDPLPPLEDLMYSNNATNMNCEEMGTVSPVENGSLVMCGDVLTRVWTTPIPACGPGLVYIQTITLDDVTPPQFTNPPSSSLTLTCITDLPPLVDLDWTDNCDGMGTTPGVESGSLEACQGGSITRTWEITDACGNGPVTFTQIITVSAPVPTPCDDMDACTINDMETIACDGTVCIPCAGVITDCSGVTEMLPCDDMDDCTINDMEEVACDGSVCVPCQGEITDCTNGLTFDEPCSDGDPCTINDMRTIDCQGQVCVPCAGTPTTTPDPMLQGPELTCEGETATLTATGCSGDVIWYSDPAGINIVNVGPSFQTPIITTNTTYYAVCDINGCLSNIVGIPVNVTTPIDPTITGDDTICQGETTVLDAGPGYSTYGWGSSSDQTLTVFSSGTYTVTVTDSNGCTSTDDFNVSVISPEEPEISGSLTYCIGGDTELSVDPSFTGIQWAPNGEMTPSIIVNSEGTYAVTVTDNNGCTSSTSVEVMESTSLNPQIIGDLIYCQGGTTNLTAGNFAMYSWAPNGETTSSINVGSEGTYSVTVTDSNGCTGESSVEVFENTIPPVTISGDDLICEGDDTTLDAFNIDYGNYIWSTGSVNSSITINQADIYSVTVFDINGCTSSTSIDVGYFPSTDLTISGDLAICDGLATTLSAQTGYASYVWSPGGENTSSISVSSAGTYSLTTTDNNGCTFSSSVNVVSLNDLELFIDGSLSYCEGGFTELNAGSWDTYVWSPNGEMSQTITVNTPGNYGVTVSDSNGCTTSSSVMIQEDTELSPMINGDMIVCPDELASIFVQGAFTDILWSDNTTNNFNTVFAGTYSVTVTDNSGCTGSSEITVVEQAAEQVIISGTLDICSGTTTDLAASDGFDSYSWSNGLSTQSVTVNTAETFEVVATDSNGCTSSSAVMVNVSSIDPPEINGTPVICAGEATELSAGGFVQYEWSTGEMTPSITVTSGDNYLLTVTDAFGCTNSSVVSVTENTPPNVIILGSTSYCIGGFTDLSVDGDFTQITWSTTESTATISIASEGAVSVTVTDANGCTASSNVTIQEDSELSPSISGDLLVCENGNTDLSVVGNYPIISWSNNATENSISVGIGTYSVTVTDNSGCTGSSQVEVTQQANQVVSILGQTEFCQGSSTDLTASDGFDSYLWSTGINGQILTVTMTGMYSVTATDMLGCTASSTLMITAQDVTPPEIEGPSMLCTGETITLSTMGYSIYEWSTGDMSSSITIDDNGNYSVTVTDDLGCTSSSSVIITENNLPMVTIVGSTSFCIGGFTELSLNDDYDQVLWSTGDNTPQVSVMMTGPISVTVTDANGCTGSSDVMITQEEFLSPNIGGNLTLCNGESTTLDAGAAFVSWVWSTGDMTQTLTTDVSGPYSVTVSDNSGCTGESTVEVIVNANPEPNIVGDLMLCQDETTIVSLDADFDEYLWSTGDASPTLDVLGPELVSVTVTDSNGCTGVSAVDITLVLSPQIVSVMTDCNDDMTAYTIALVTSGDNVVADPYTVNFDGTSFSIEDIDVATGVDITISNTTTGCDTLINIQPPNCDCLAVSDAGNNQEIDCINTSATLSGPLTSSGMGFEYAWFDDEGNQIGNDESITVMEGGEYTLEVIDLSNGCSDFSNVTVLDMSNDPVAIIQADPDNIIDCVIDVVMLSTEEQTNVEYTWTFNKLESSELFIEVSDQGEAMLVAVDTITGCSDIATLFIEDQEEYPLIIIADPADLNCTTGELTLDASASQSGTDILYQWYDENGPIDLETSSTLDISNPGMYYFEAIDTSNNCINTDTVEVIEIINYPEITTEEDFTLPCDINSVTITVDIVSQFSTSSTWSTSDGNILSNVNLESIEVNAPGWYYVSVADQLSGCITNDSIQIFPNLGPQAFMGQVNQPSCEFVDGGVIDLTVSAGGVEPFVYYINGQESQDGQFNGLTADEYLIEVVDALGCTHDTLIILDEPAMVELSISDPIINSTFGASETVTLMTNVDENMIADINWLPELEIPCQNCLEITIDNIMSNQSYLITLIDENGCQDTTTFQLIIEQKEDIYIPNIIITSDDENGKFYPQSGTDGVIAEEMYIFDRWGNLVYSDSMFPTNDPQYGWDATFNGEQVQAGVYVYAFVFDVPGLGRVLKSGDVTVIY